MLGRRSGLTSAGDTAGLAAAGKLNRCCDSRDISDRLLVLTAANAADAADAAAQGAAQANSNGAPGTKRVTIGKTPKKGGGDRRRRYSVTHDTLMSSLERGLEAAGSKELGVVGRTTSWDGGNSAGNSPRGPLDRCDPLTSHLNAVSWVHRC